MKSKTVRHPLFQLNVFYELSHDDLKLEFSGKVPSYLVDAVHQFEADAKPLIHSDILRNPTDYFGYEEIKSVFESDLIEVINND